MTPLNNQSDPEIEMLIVGHRPQIRAFLLSLTGSDAAADDLTQETCLVIWEKRDAFETSGNFKAWAFRIAFLQTQNYRRKLSRQRSRELPGDALFDRIADAATAQHGQTELEEVRHAALLICLKKLTEPHRDLLLSRYQDGTSLELLSRNADLNRNAMAQKLFRIKKTLLRCVEKQISATKF